MHPKCIINWFILIIINAHWLPLIAIDSHSIRICDEFVRHGRQVCLFVVCLIRDTNQWYGYLCTDTFCTNLWKASLDLAISRSLLKTVLITLWTSVAAVWRVRVVKCHRRSWSSFNFCRANTNFCLGMTVLGHNLMRSSNNSFNSTKTLPHFVGESFSLFPFVHLSNWTRSFVPRNLR